MLRKSSYLSQTIDYFLGFIPLQIYDTDANNLIQLKNEFYNFELELEIADKNEIDDFETDSFDKDQNKN